MEVRLQPFHCNQDSRYSLYWRVKGSSGA
jgi:hypothetical protein